MTSGLLAALQPLGPDEQIVLQWVIQPAGPTAAVTGTPPVRVSTLLWGVRPEKPGKEEFKAERAKKAHPLLHGTARVGVTASPAQAGMLVGRVAASFHAANAPGAHFLVRRLPNAVVVHSITGRHLPLIIPPSLLNAAELAMLLGIPTGDVALPGLRFGGSRQLAPSVDIPRIGRVVAQSTFPGAELRRWRCRCPTRCGTCT